MNTYKPNRHRVRADTLLFVEYKNVLHLRTYVLYHSLSAVSTTSRHLFIIFQNVTIQSRFRMDNTRVVLARKHVLSILNLPL